MSSPNYCYPDGTNGTPTGPNPEPPTDPNPEPPTTHNQAPPIQYIEYDPNPPPGVYYPPAPPPAVVAPFGAPFRASPVSEPLAQPQRLTFDFEDDEAEQQEEKKKPWTWVGELWVRAKEGRFSKHKMAMLIVGILFVLVVTISAPILASGKHDHEHDKDHDHDHDHEPSATESSGTSASSTSSSPKETGPIPRKCEPTEYTQGMEWVGILDGEGWDFDLVPAGTATKCCAHCYSKGRQCNAWLYVPGKGNAPRCTIVHGYEGDGADEECPNGKPVILSKENDGGKGSAGGAGPCSGVGSTSR